MHLWLTVVFLMAVGAAVESQTPVRDQAQQSQTADAMRAGELIKLAHAAIGGEAGIGKVQTLSAEGKYRRFVRYVSVQSPSKVLEKERTLSGKMEFEFALPGKFRRRVTGETLRGFGYSFTQIVNGDNAWREPPLRPISSYRDRRVIDVSDVERTEFIQATGAKQELTYYSIGWLLQALPSYPLEMSYAGEYQLDANLTHAVIAKGQSGFQFVILFDVKTHLPRSIAISFVEDIQQTVIVEAAGFFNRRYMQETFARARAERRARTRPPQQYEMVMRFSDHRRIVGINLPHRITTILNGQVMEELTINEFDVNRPLNPKQFAGPPAEKD